MSAYAKLNRDQRAFVDLLVQRKTGSDAIRELRPWVKRPDVLASQWKALPEVREALAEREAEAMDEAGITNTQILLSIAETMNLSVKDFFHEDGRPKAVHELSDAAARNVAGIECEMLEGGAARYRYKMPNRNEAKKLLGQFKKLWTDNLEVQHSGPLIIEVVKFGKAKDSA